MQNKRLLQFLWIPLCALLTVLFLVLTLLEAIPAPASPLELSEQAHVSASLKTGDEQNKVYLCQLSGELFNPTAEEIRLDTVKLRMEDADGEEYTLYLTDLTVRARSSLALKAEWESARPYERITSITAVTPDREALQIRARDGVSPIVLLLVALTLLSALATYHFIRQHRYALEEEKALRSRSTP